MSKYGMVLSKEEIFQHSNQMFAIGDIEGKEGLFESTRSLINAYRESIFIFLGDLIGYTQRDINRVIEIMKLLSVPDTLNIYRIFNNDEAIKGIIEFLYAKTLIGNKKLYIKSQFSRNIRVCPSQNRIIDISRQNYLFLFGNKEIKLIQCLRKSILERRNDKLIFVLPNYYSIRHNTSFYEFDLESFSFLMNYLNLCQHFIIVDDILFVHNYINKKHLIGESGFIVKTIISGHNKWYGHFKWKFWQLKFDVYVIDLTPYEDETEVNENLINCMMIYQNGNETRFECSFNPPRFMRPKNLLEKYFYQVRD